MISIHAPLTGSDSQSIANGGREKISIHAPLTGSDPDTVCDFTALPFISIHAPLTGSDLHTYGRLLQETISIHAPLTGSDLFNKVQRLLQKISIHAPLTGSDGCKNANQTKRGQFQSTLPLRGATSQGSKRSPYTFYFNPRSPYGERRDRYSFFAPFTRFQSTLPLRGATCHNGDQFSWYDISIHAPLTGSDRSILILPL